MRKNVIKYVFVTLMVVDAFLGGMWIEQQRADERMAFVQEAIEDGDRVVFCEDGGIIRIRHDK